jgi:hypothetical protein
LKKIRIAISVALLSTIIYLCHQIVNLSLENQTAQQDYAEINDIEYGLLSINQWKIKISQIVNEEALFLTEFLSHEKPVRKRAGASSSDEETETNTRTELTSS